VSLLVVGSVALDTIETPFGYANEVVGGSATYFSASASHLAPVSIVGVVGHDYPLDRLAALETRGVDLSGVERASGESFRWRGRYRHDLSAPETLETRLGVFANFRPRIPPALRSSEYLFLANIDPGLQIDVLNQVESPTFVACDTMNFWIEGRRDALLRLLSRVDMLVLNDGEARQLTGQPNLVQAARWILGCGPRYVTIKKGEHGALMFSREAVFFAPAYPLEQLFDPTGAGDSFAGGFMGWLARTGDTSEANLRRAVVYGSAMGSFAVERFSIDRLLEITSSDVEQRVAEFRTLVSFDRELAPSPA
jgi:sugar/nucleoside kinase (ribokinase family)